MELKFIMFLFKTNKKKRCKIEELAKAIKKDLNTPYLRDSNQELIVKEYRVKGTAYNYVFSMVIDGSDYDLKILLMKHTFGAEDNNLVDSDILKTRKEFDYGFTDKSLFDIANDFIKIKEAYEKHKY